jgi:hypothetical protein
MTHHRRENPETGVVVAYGLGAAAIIGLGVLAYKAFSKPSGAASGPLASLPPFDAASTDTDHGYMISVYTTSPVHLDKDPTGMAVTPYLGSLPVDHIVVTGPFGKNDKPPPPATPTPDLVLAVSLSGLILEAMSKEQADALKKMMGA